MLSLCDILAIVYSKLVEDNNSSENIYLFLAILRFDERIKVRFQSSYACHSKVLTGMAYLLVVETGDRPSAQGVLGLGHTSADEGVA